MSATVQSIGQMFAAQLKLRLAETRIPLGNEKEAQAEISRKPTTDVWIQWGVFVGICIPIAIALFIFGLFALKGEYDRLPTRSSDR